MSCLRPLRPREMPSSKALGFLPKTRPLQVLCAEFREFLFPIPEILTRPLFKTVFGILRCPKLVSPAIAVNGSHRDENVGVVVARIVLLGIRLMQGDIDDVAFARLLQSPVGD